MSIIKDKSFLEPGIDVGPTYYRVRQKAPGLFSTCRTMVVGKVIDAIKGIICKLKKTGKWQMQSYLFLKTKWTTARVRAWIKAHGLVISGEEWETEFQAQRWLFRYFEGVQKKHENPRVYAWLMIKKEERDGRDRRSKKGARKDFKRSI